MRAGWRSGVYRHAELAVAVATAGLLIVAAALPDDGARAARTAAGATPVSTALAPGRENTFGAYLGNPYTYPSDFWLKKDGTHDFKIKNVEWFTKPFNNPLYYGARIQHWFEGGRFGAMLDFTHSKAFAPLDQERPFEGTIDGKPAPATVNPGDYFDKLEWSHGHNMLTLNGLVRLATFGRISPYAGAGLGVSLPHSEIHLRADPSRTYEYQYTGFTYQALFGIELRLRTGSVFLEYKFTDADYNGPLSGRDGSWLPIDMYNQLSRWWSGEPTRDGWAGARLTSHQAIGGFLARFVPAEAVTTQ